LVGKAGLPVFAGELLGAAGESGGGGQVRSLYIHVPFCFHKCHYCDFYSIVDTQDRQEAFVARLRRELNALAAFAAAPLDTIFVGGGTPSLLVPRLWRALLDDLHALFGAAEMRARGGEFSVECNPETVTAELMDVLVSGGVTRVSMGAQSFNQKHLKTLERWHNPENVPKALEFARAAGIGRQSIDLIFAIPGQTMEDWLADLAIAVSLNTEHLSCYGLTYEPGTAMTARLKRGDFTPSDEDLEADMFDATLAYLRGQGLDRYEISNFARAGAECRHNMVYWRQGDWLAAGPSASGHLRGLRWKNSPRLDDYLRKDSEGFAPFIEHELPDSRRGLFERMRTGLRLAEGVDAGEVMREAAGIGAGVSNRLAEWERRQVAAGNLRVGDGRWQLTDDGMRVTNTVLIAASDAIDGE